MSTPGAPRNPQGHPQERSWLSIPVVGDAPRRGRAGLRLGLGKEIPGGWDSTFPCVPLSHCRDRAWHRGPGPRHRQGRDGRGAEPGDSRPMAFPDRGPGDVGEQKALSVLRPERRAGGAGWGWIWELCTRSRPAPSHPVPSCPVSSHQPHGTTL